MTVLKRLVVPALALTAVAIVGCGHDSDHGGSGMSTGMQSGDKPVEGNPRATTGPAAGYPQSDTSDYHPLTDDTRNQNGSGQYHPAPMGTVQPTTRP